MRTIDANSLPEFKIQNGIKVKKSGNGNGLLKKSTIEWKHLELECNKNKFLFGSLKFFAYEIKSIEEKAAMKKNLFKWPQKNR